MRFVCVCVSACLFTQSHNAGRRGRKTQGQAGPSERSLTKCQAHSERHSTEMPSRRGSRATNSAEMELRKANARQILIIITPSD